MCVCVLCVFIARMRVREALLSCDDTETEHYAQIWDENTTENLMVFDLDLYSGFVCRKGSIMGFHFIS